MTTDVAHESPVEPRSSGSRSWRLCAAAGILIVLAAILAWFPPIARNRRPDEVFFAHNLMIVSALPWFLQWAAVAIALWAFSSQRSADWRAGGVFAILSTFTLGLVWWGGLAVRFWGKAAMEAMTDEVFESVRQHLGEFDLLFEYVGPLISPFTLQGPLVLDGWRFLITLASTTLVMAYLMLVGRFGHMGRRGTALPDVLRILAGLLVFFLPPFIRLGIRLWRVW
jgi:hypothetical protein